MPDSTVYPAEQRFSGDFWKFLTGQSISTLGSSFTSFALPLLIFKLTGSALNLAFTVVATVLPYLLLGLVIGAWADRVQRKRLMIGTDLARALVIASIPLAFALGLLSVWWIYAVAFVASTLSICFDAANFAAVPSLVPRDELVKANGRIQASYSMAKIVGPLLAGLLIIVVPLPMLLLVDASSFLVSAASLVLIRASFNAAPNEKRVTTSVRHDIREGLRYVLKHPVLRSITLLLLFINFILPTTTSQLVLFARQWLGASDTQIGLLYAGGSVGIVLFSLGASRLRKRMSFGALVLASLAFEGIMTAATAFTHAYWIALLCWLLRGGCDALFIIGSYSLTQDIVPNHFLGRVITTMRVLTWSTASLGALIGGFAIEQTKNAGLVYITIGLLAFLMALAFWLTPLRYAERYVSDAG
ncbi:MAG TPA: MFS transporter [Ktedonobacteraceae bacterium]|nr:MFS transporter [Ktedonobacteraceae bacterium]